MPSVLPRRRGLVVLALVLVFFVVIWHYESRLNARSVISTFIDEQRFFIPGPEDRISASDLGTRDLLLHLKDGDSAYSFPPTELFHDYVYGDASQSPLATQNPAGPRYIAPHDDYHLLPLLQCRIAPNKYTAHIRIPVHIRPIDMVPENVTLETDEKRSAFNPTIISLPHWSENQYLLVTRILTDGASQQNVICEANICYVDPAKARPGEKPCTADDQTLFGGQEGMRCATVPHLVRLPTAPSKWCGWDVSYMADVLGFLDPRIFWSGKGEPLMIMNAQ